MYLFTVSIDKVAEKAKQATGSASEVWNKVTGWTANAAHNTVQWTGSVFADVKEWPVNAGKKALTWIQTAVGDVSSWVLQSVVPDFDKKLGYVTFGIIGVILCICVIVIIFVGIKFSRRKVQHA